MKRGSCVAAFFRLLVSSLCTLTVATTTYSVYTKSANGSEAASSQIVRSAEETESRRSAEVTSNGGVVIDTKLAGRSGTDGVSRASGFASASGKVYGRLGKGGKGKGRTEKSTSKHDKTAHTTSRRREGGKGGKGKGRAETKGGHKSGKKPKTGKFDSGVSDYDIGKLAGLAVVGYYAYQAYEAYAAYEAVMYMYYASSYYYGYYGYYGYLGLGETSEEDYGMLGAGDYEEYDEYTHGASESSAKHSAVASLASLRRNAPRVSASEASVAEPAVKLSAPPPLESLKSLK